MMKTSDRDLLVRANELLHQAETEKSHYYTADIVRRLITALQISFEALETLKQWDDTKEVDKALKKIKKL